MYVYLNSDKVKRETSNIYSNLSEALHGVNDVRNTVNNISMIWKGEEYKQFSNKMNSFIEDINKFEESLETFMNYANNYVSAHEKLDSHYSNEQIKIK